MTRASWSTILRASRERSPTPWCVSASCRSSPSAATGSGRSRFPELRRSSGRRTAGAELRGSLHTVCRDRLAACLPVLGSWLRDRGGACCRRVRLRACRYPRDRLFHGAGKRQVYRGHGATGHDARRRVRPPPAARWTPAAEARALSARPPATGWGCRLAASRSCDIPERWCRPRLPRRFRVWSFGSTRQRPRRDALGTVGRGHLPSRRQGGSASVLYGFAVGELCERVDGLLWVGHRVQLVLDAVCRVLECVVVQEHANGVAS